ncbi:MAG TPA: bifunctional phosphopantothenoylcysteine decarboxylase/phosphopantothenate--cysteine ligase CoaBC [Candidatus Saccharimonadales bacterium]|nr:bifunctional phosphopantothenoylcysteine decarboxylase/phosphopantothenate--cysteine ligase CoaBC [Candidatus Saccharimonadales bacterium]
MKIALGVSGGIAAYKAAEIARRLQDRDIRVQVVMTNAAQEFVRPLTFAALTGEKVITEMFSQRDSSSTLDSSVEHIGVAQSIDALLVAPATAATLARFAHGLAEDFLSTLYLATTAPVIVAPAMNVNMWRHPATQVNLQTLRSRDVTIVEPGEGYLACGMTGEGRLADTETIVDAVLARLVQSQDLKGEHILISAGPTYEPIDPVRFLGNRSSGKMGYALAEAALRRGARVTLVSGPTALTPPPVEEFVQVETTAQMREALLGRFGYSSITIMTAAVSDFAPAKVSSQKIKREAAMNLDLQPTADILAELGNTRAPGQLLIGFAAETHNVLENARQKLARKHLDAIVVNDVSRPGLGFGSERNAGEVITADDATAIPEMSKREMADRILDAVVKLRARQQTPKVTA